MMDSKGLILLPTLNRTKLLKRFCEHYNETGATVPVWILVDHEDYSKNVKEIYKIRETVSSDWCVFDTENNVSMGDKIRFVWENVKSQEILWVGLLNDDHVCLTPEWDKKVESLIDGTNMVSTNDGSWNFGLNPVGLTAWSMDLLEVAGFPIFPGQLQHWFIDDLWKAIGESTGCWLETSKINIAHKHVYRGDMEADETFSKIQNVEQINDSRKEFENFMREDFKSVCERIMKFREPKMYKEKFA